MNRIGESSFDTHCEITNEETGQKVKGEVHNFKDKKFLSVVLNQAVEIKLTYNPRSKVYYGSKGGMDFVSNGPVEHIAHVRSR